MNNELPSPGPHTENKSFMMAQSHLQAYIPLGRPKHHVCFVLCTEGTTVTMNDLQPHTKLAGREFLQLGKAHISHAFWERCLLPERGSKVGQLQAHWNSFLL